MNPRKPLFIERSLGPSARRILLAGLMAGAALFARAATAPSGPAKSEDKADAKATETAPAGPEAQLKADMPAEAVEKIMGKPADVKPMTAPDGHAEIWVYRRLVDHRVERVEVGAIPITDVVISADGKAHTVVVGEKIQYADVHIDTELTVELLIFNGRYVTSKSSRRELRHYE